jgi:hypothetical protein
LVARKTNYLVIPTTANKQTFKEENIWLM